MGMKISNARIQTPLLLQISQKFQTCPNFVLPMVFTFQIHHCTLLGNQKPQLSVKRVLVERNGVRFGNRGQQ